MAFEVFVRSEFLMRQNFAPVLLLVKFLTKARLAVNWLKVMYDMKRGTIYLSNHDRMVEYASKG